MASYWWPLMGESVTTQEREALARFVLSAPRLTYGEEIKRFEQAWSEWNGSAISLFVNSGTSADYLIITACKYLHNWSEEAEILVPAVTWGTTISAVINLGLKPVLVDIDPRTLAMNVEDARRKVTPQTRALFLTHCLGLPNDIDAMQKLAADHSLVLLEDCCEAHGARWSDQRVGNFGAASSFSFFWGHHMTTLEGGMVCLHDGELAEVARSMRNHGLTRDLANRSRIEADYCDLDDRFCFWTPGFNFRGTEMHARLGQMQLQRLDFFIAQRNRNYREFVQLAEKFARHFTTFYAPPGGEASSYALGFLFESAATKDKVLHHLEAAGIETRPLISGNLAHQPFMHKYLVSHNRTVGPLPGADRVHQCGMYIGNSQFVDQSHLTRLDKLLTECLS